MKKTLLISALTLALAVPVFAAESDIINGNLAGQIPVFGNEDPNYANLGLEDLDHKKEELEKARAREEARRERAKKSEANQLANANIDNNLEMDNGRITKKAAMQNLSEEDPDYVPPERARKPRKITKKNKVDNGSLPVLLKGDHVEYENQTGDFMATGKVRIRQGTELLMTEYCFGNFKDGDIYMLEGGTILEPGNRTNAKWIHYNFNSKTGELKEVSGRGTKDFYKAEHALVMPDKLVADKGGVTTRCTAQKHVPCMHVKAESMEFYPKEKMVAHEVKFFIKGVHVYSRKLWVNEFKEKKDILKPSVGWDGKDNGFYVRFEDSIALSEKDNVHAAWTKYSRAGYRPMYNYSHNERNWYFTYKNGWEESSDYWYYRENYYHLGYKSHRIIDKLPITYSAYIDYGLLSSQYKKNDKTVYRNANWGRNGSKSWQRDFGYYINHDPIKLLGPDTTLHLTYGRRWTHESLSDEKRTTNMYYATLRQKVNDNLYMWASNLRQKSTSSMFDLGQPDMEREFRLGAQYKASKNDVISIVNRYDYGKHGQYETIYNWYHRFCCWAIQVSYEKEWYKDDKTVKIQYFLYNW